MKMNLFAMIIVIVLTFVSCGGENSAPLGMSAEPTELFTYIVNAEYNGIVLTGYSGTKTTLKIPDTIDDLPIVGIESTCFAVGQVTKVEFPATVKYFRWGDKKLNSAKDIEFIVIPEGVTEIAPETFKDFGALTRITIPLSVTDIGDKAFFYCTSLTHIVIPDGVKTIGKMAFWHCVSLRSAFIPDSVTEIGIRAFYGCISLTKAVYKTITYSYNKYYANLPQEFYDAVNGNQ